MTSAIISPKFEEHEFEGKKRKFCVHRKGGDARLWKRGKRAIALLQSNGAARLVPGDMGRASHLMAGTGNPLTWCSACHGAGRRRSRVKSMESWKGRDMIEHLKSQGVSVMASSKRTIAEEMPDAYKTSMPWFKPLKRPIWLERSPASNLPLSLRGRCLLLSSPRGGRSQSFCKRPRTSGP